MISTELATHLAYLLLERIDKQMKKSPTYRLFYDDYRFFFSPGKVPVVNQIVEEKTGKVIMVEVDCNLASEFLKERYRFQEPSELKRILEEEAEAWQATIPLDK